MAVTATPKGRGADRWKIYYETEVGGSVYGEKVLNCTFVLLKAKKLAELLSALPDILSIQEKYAYCYFLCCRI